MARAGVFIGVDRTGGGMPPLRDAANGARRMHAWALTQGLADRTHARLITDDGGAIVDTGQIKRAIREILNGPGVDQLMVYFAGHGLNISHNEHWLLSEAPDDPNAAVSVQGSVELAYFCGAQHVVMISDACRVAPEGIQATGVRGVQIFPNFEFAHDEKPVDRLYACGLGAPAAEIKDPNDAAKGFQALYTTSLLEALDGRPASLLRESVSSADDNAAFRYVMPRDLGDHLKRALRQRLIDLGLQFTVNQTPAHRIESDDLWIAKVKKPPVVLSPIIIPPAHGLDGSPADDLDAVTQRLIQSAIAGDATDLLRNLDEARAAPAFEGEQLAATVERVVQPFGPDHFETSCGIKVRGARIVEVFGPRVTAEPPLADGTLVRVHAVDGPAASLLLRFAGGSNAVIPVIPGFIAALTFERDSLVDVAYEPSANDWRWGMYRERAEELRALRAVAASSSQLGQFQLEGPDAFAIAQKMQYAKSIDPALAVYAAYGYAGHQVVNRIRDMSGYLQGDLGVTLFDLALLSRALVGKPITPDDRIVPFVPLLAQGWGIVDAHGVRLHTALAGLERHTLTSLWSLYDDTGADRIRNAMQTGDVR